jgi:predicted dehydrogenase
MSEKIRAAIVGLGRIASLLEDDAKREKPCTHAGAIAASPDCVLAGGADTAADRREAFAHRYHCPVYSDAEQMLRELTPHVLHIATHPDSHLHYVLLAARYGVKVVVCEKPLARTFAESRKIAALHARGATKIITNHERR